MMLVHDGGVYEQPKSLGVTLGSNSRYNHKEDTNHLSAHLGVGKKFITMGKQI